jgi:hypothetical protein
MSAQDRDIANVFKLFGDEHFGVGDENFFF